ncbi:hypothetical protein NKR19_g3628 [Coniochaeta hoffmannii]|uniref:AB hydrolase-1 domain-containing protein n=1 Tax=Coniochaeta hoffmannii TaxID=91930 RepID=A0AA38VR69_9PEZI|nr:hypothetical protein NKR19_g3628 [Coniochaeta hoffmannii]
MPFFTSPVDSTSLFYRYYTPDEEDDKSFRPLFRYHLVFLHGWPMSSRMFEHLFVPLCETYRFRILAPDRRGFGKSDWNSKQTDRPITYDTFAADVVGLLEHLDIKDFVFVGAILSCKNSERGSSGLGRPCPILSRHLNTLWGLQAGNQLSVKTLEHFERIIVEADGIALEKTCTLINQKTMDGELRELTAVTEARRPAVLILHGDADQGMPIEASSKTAKEMLPWTELKVYENAGHGLYLTHAGRDIDDLVEFVDKLR